MTRLLPLLACGLLSAEPGSFMNPYVVAPRAGGGYTISPQLPSLTDGESNFAPGGYNNPVVVKPVVPGSSTLSVGASSPWPLIGDVAK